MIFGSQVYSILKGLFLQGNHKKMITIFFLCYPIFAYSQIRHTTGDQMAGAYYSFANKTNAVGAAYQYFLLDNISLKGSLSYEDIAFKLSDYHSFILKPELLYTLFSNKKSLFFNLKGGLLSGLESTKNEIINQNKNNFFYGALLGTTLEIYISSKVKIELEFEQRFLLKSLVANYRPYFTIGTFIKL
jgi:hypothetical protein